MILYMFSVRVSFHEAFSHVETLDLGCRVAEGWANKKLTPKHTTAC